MTLWRLILAVISLHFMLLCFSSGDCLWHFFLKHILDQGSLSSAPQLPPPTHKAGLVSKTHQLLCLQGVSLPWPQNVITIFLSLTSHTSFSLACISDPSHPEYSNYNVF